MDFNAQEHLDLSLRLTDLIRKTIKPLVGVYEDIDHPIGKTGDMTFEVDMPIENAVQDFFEESGISAKVITEDRGEIIFGDDPEAIYLIDPLDGSRNARRGLPIYATSIAVYPPEADYLDEAQVGVVSRLDVNDDYTVISGLGALLNGKKITSSSKTDFTNSIACVGTHFAKAYKVHADIVERLSGIVDSEINDINIKYYGSTSIELALLAAGNIDLIIDFRAGFGLTATPKTYDIAAGLLLCREAGAQVMSGGNVLPDRLPIDPNVRVQLFGACNKELLNKASKYLF